MIACDDALLEQWRPNFSSSGQRGPTWTRAACRGVLLCNSLEWVDWHVNPVQVVLCDACGHPGCASGGYVHVSHVGDHVLWTRPHVNESDAWARDQYEAAWPIRRFGAVILAVRTWASWRQVVPDLPAPYQLRATSGRELHDAWLHAGSDEQGLPAATALVPSLRGRVLASDSLDADAAIDHVQDMVAELSALRSGQVSGRFVRAQDVGARVEVLYFDGPAAGDWPAFAFMGSRVVPAFSREWVFIRDGARAV